MNTSPTKERRRDEIELKRRRLSTEPNPFSRAKSRPIKPVATTLSTAARATLLKLSSQNESDETLKLPSVGIGRSYFNNAYHVPPPAVELDRRLTAMNEKITNESIVAGELSTLTAAQRRLLERAAIARANAKLRGSV